jgi:WD40 repeat protein
MELQKVNTLSLNNRKTHDRGMFENETEMLKDKLKRTNDRLSQATKAFRSDVERVDIRTPKYRLYRSRWSASVSSSGSRTGRSASGTAMNSSLPLWKTYWAVKQFLRQDSVIDFTLSEDKHKVRHRINQGEILSIKTRTINEGTFIISGSIDHTIKIWSFDKHVGITVIQTLIGHEGAVRPPLIRYST